MINFQNQCLVGGKGIQTTLQGNKWYRLTHFDSQNNWFCQRYLQQLMTWMFQWVGLSYKRRGIIVFLKKGQKWLAWSLDQNKNLSQEIFLGHKPLRDQKCYLILFCRVKKISQETKYKSPMFRSPILEVSGFMIK